eukprot:GFUD01024227.1.p1 GENE.GFUD01024227.1~~GFUD01024227.1.p1  ORF type:complete len:212 (+),score=79.63 GFUD01024227.1:80-715(+)
MSWTWTGYDLDAVHRFKDEAFFQTGRNSAEARFWKLKIHEEDRRGTKSSIAFDKDAEKDEESTAKPEDAENQEAAVKKDEKEATSHYNPTDYKYSYAQPPNDNSKDYQNTNSQAPQDFSPEYHYTYPNPRDRSMSIVSTISRRGTPFTASKDYQYSYPEEEEMVEDKDEQKEDDEKESKSTKKAINNVANFKSFQEDKIPQSVDHVSSRFY